MGRAEKKLRKQLKKRLSTAPQHFLLWTAEPGDGMTLTGQVDDGSEALVAASMALFANMGTQQRRTVHLLMTHAMENSAEDIWQDAGEEYR